MTTNSSAFIVPTKPEPPPNRLISEFGKVSYVVDSTDIKVDTYLMIDASNRGNIFTRLFQILRFIFTGKIRI